MSIFSTALHRCHVKTFVDEQPAASPRFEMICVVVASKDAWQVRKALSVCPDTSVRRCLPTRKDEKVKLEIRFPAWHGDAVIGRVLACLNNGEIGRVVGCANVSPKTRHLHSNVYQIHGL